MMDLRLGEETRKQWWKQDGVFNRFPEYDFGMLHGIVKEAVKEVRTELAKKLFNF